MMDGDAQHNPEEIPDVTRPILDGAADVVIGSRFLDRDSDHPTGERQANRLSRSSRTRQEEEA